jgi:cob(I)alamin adenosyltransferase
MQYYTKRGDQGNTNIITGRTVRKDSTRVEAYGTIDELNSLIGLIVSQVDGENLDLKDELLMIQHFLFDCGTDLAVPDEKIPYKITEEETKFLEQRIDYYTPIPVAVDKFIIPGGSPLASLMQLARTVTRRAERRIVTFINEEEKTNRQVQIFVNRLSDYFFALGRVVNHNEGIKEPLYERGGTVFHESFKTADKRMKKED